MMNNRKHNRYSWLKAMYVLPVVAVSLFATAKTVTDYKVANIAIPAASRPAVTTQKATMTHTDTTSLDRLEQKVAQKSASKFKDAQIASLFL